MVKNTQYFNLLTKQKHAFYLFLFFSVLTELNSPQTQTRHTDRKQRDTDQTTVSTSDTMNEPERGSVAEGYVQTGHQV